MRAAFLGTFAPLQGLKPPYRLLVMGGSGGARALNEALFAVAAGLLDANPQWEILQQTGRDAEVPASLHPRHRVADFIDDVAGTLEASSLVLCRAGAVTCAELRACGRPSLLVPLPSSAGDHQRLNALAMAGEGRAELVEQGEGFAGRLRDALAALLASPERRLELARPEANTAVAGCLDDLAALGG